VHFSSAIGAPPYTAYIGNLPYEVTEDSVIDFFAEAEVECTSVRIPRDADTDRIKGFGYAEFMTVPDLKAALELSGEKLDSRPIRIDLAEGGGDKGGGGGSGFGRSRADDDGAWRRPGDSGGGGGGGGGGGFGGAGGDRGDVGRSDEGSWGRGEVLPQSDRAPPRGGGGGYEAPRGGDRGGGFDRGESMRHCGSG
jgi:hypothetical protein